MFACNRTPAACVMLSRCVFRCPWSACAGLARPLECLRGPRRPPGHQHRIGCMHISQLSTVQDSPSSLSERARGSFRSDGRPRSYCVAASSLRICFDAGAEEMWRGCGGHERINPSGVGHEQGHRDLLVRIVSYAVAQTNTSTNIKHTCDTGQTRNAQALRDGSVRTSRIYCLSGNSAIRPPSVIIFGTAVTQTRRYVAIWAMAERRKAEEAAFFEEVRGLLQACSPATDTAAAAAEYVT